MRIEGDMTHMEWLDLSVYLIGQSKPMLYESATLSSCCKRFGYIYINVLVGNMKATVIHVLVFLTSRLHLNSLIFIIMIFGWNMKDAVVRTMFRLLILPHSFLRFIVGTTSHGNACMFSRL